MTDNIAFYAQFIEAKLGSDGITVTWDVERITRDDGSHVGLVTGAATNITIGRNGLYGYLLTGANLQLYDYVATAITADADVDQQEIPAMWTYWSIGTWSESERTLTSGSWAADVWNYGIRTLTSISGVATAAEIWGYATRTLTQTAAAIASILTGSTITVPRGDTISITLTGLGSLAGRTKLWFTVKGNNENTDIQSIIQIEENAGLTYFNGEVAATPADGSVTVDDEDAGDITITLIASRSAELEVTNKLVYDVQVLATTVTTLTSGDFIVSGDVTRATS